MQKRERQKSVMPVCLNIIWCEPFLEGSEEEQRWGLGGTYVPHHPTFIHTHNMYTLMKIFAIVFQENTHIFLNICPIFYFGFIS